MKIYKLFLISTALLSQIVSADVLRFYQVNESSEKLCEEALLGDTNLIDQKIKNNLVSIVNVDPDKSFNVDSTTKDENKLVITGKLFAEPEDPNQKLLGVTLHAIKKNSSETLIKTEVNLKYNTPQLIAALCNSKNSESKEMESSELWFATLTKN
ncbi:hypothetical protein [Zooshikella harenae]|uniref:YceI family protein n=1 Tax=Zooshikella harenae TaxID=2827238 RepID=A0ABS5ZBV3_9GAMM|nr:hypothetical protein [Zooshikella harenae]MBU2710791.1 hypothetical protein [Zooshikella harenae]